MEKWLVVGGGISGLGAARLLVAHGKKVLLSDRQPIDAQSRKQLETCGVDIAIANDQSAHLDGITHVVASPGVPVRTGVLAEASAQGLPIISEIELALENFDGTVVAVTGTNGKSTTCMMLEHCLRAIHPDALAVGNIGISPCDLRANNRLTSPLVVEVSSYQLETCHHLPIDVAIFTSFSPDHLARHGTLREYFLTKWKLLSLLLPSGACILSQKIVDIAAEFHLALPEHGPSAFILGSKCLPINWTERTVSLAGQAISIPENILGEHNFRNAAMALKACHFLYPSVSLHVWRKQLATFQGLPHRCEVIGSINQQPIINDSKSTNLESTLVALSMTEKPVILMMGGQGKGEPYLDLSTQKDRIIKLITFGHSGPQIAQDATQTGIAVEHYNSMEDATLRAKVLAQLHAAPLLFSPGCASFDAFKNFEHRGEVFRTLVQS